MSSSPVERRSYAQRRELFKNIWNATMLFDDVGDAADIAIKPKVIKTLRLDQSSNLKASIRKKRLKNLRTVCNKILTFCDRQEQDELYYDNKPSGKKKFSKTKKKKIVKKVSKPPSKDSAPAKATDSERKATAAIPADRARKRMKGPVPVVKEAVPLVASQITSKLISTRSPLQKTRSPSPSRQQKVVKKNSAKKKKSTDI